MFPHIVVIIRVFRRQGRYINHYLCRDANVDARSEATSDPTGAVLAMLVNLDIHIAKSTPLEVLPATQSTEYDLYHAPKSSYVSGTGIFEIDEFAYTYSEAKRVLCGPNGKGDMRISTY